MSEPVQQLLSLLQLARRARLAATQEALGFVMVNETLQVLPYRQAALWRRGHGLKLDHISAVSGLPQPNAQAPYTQWLTRLMAQLSASENHAAPSGVRIVSAQDVPDVAADWAQWLPAHALCIYLKHGDEAAQGALLLASDQAWSPPQLALASEIASCYAHALSSMSQRSPRVNPARAILSGRKRWWWALALGVLCIPVQQSVLAPAEITPKDAFVVRSPQDGVIDRLLVAPNQAVTAGMPLFNLDQTALKTRQAVAGKALDAAQEEFRQSAQMAVTDDKGKLEMSLRRGALQEKQVELNYMNELMGRVQINAERSGIAVFSDVNDWQGKTVQVGERVLTLADPAKVELTIWLPVGERFDAVVGTVATLYPNASPLSSYEAVVRQVAYSAEPARDGQMAYQLKADLSTDQTLPRIGLIGTVKLHGSRVPLVYYALRRPMTAVRQWLGI